MATRNPYIFDTEIIPTLHDSEIVGAHDASIVETDISADTPYLSSLDSNFLYDRVFEGLAHDTFDTKPMDIGEYIDKYCLPFSSKSLYIFLHLLDYIIP